MNNPQLRPGPWVTVTTFAIAMAWVEAAVVYYLRTMIGRIEPYQPNPLPIVGGLGPVEMVREGATMIMLLTVGILAASKRLRPGRRVAFSNLRAERNRGVPDSPGRTEKKHECFHSSGVWRRGLGYTAIAFGVWDIFYYVFLKAMCGWPHSLLDWDILFLLPLPWWGPVLAPMLISLLMIIWGALVTQIEPRPAPVLSRWHWWLLNWTGVAIALYVFMADSIRVSGGGVDALRNLLPERFQWPLFSCALVLLSAPVIGYLFELNAQRAAVRFGVPALAGVTHPNPQFTSQPWRPQPTTTNRPIRQSIKHD